MTGEKVRRIDVFFYGLFMDDALLREKGINPVGRRKASLENFCLLIGARATLSELRLITIGFVFPGLKQPWAAIRERFQR